MNITVTISESRINGREWTQTVEANNANDALDLAVKAQWGPRAFFWTDSGLGFGRGQVMEDLGQGRGATSRTGRVKAEFDSTDNTLTRAQIDALNHIHDEVTGRIHRRTRDALEHRGYVRVLADGACQITPAGAAAIGAIY